MVVFYVTNDSNNPNHQFSKKTYGFPWTFPFVFTIGVIIKQGPRERSKENRRFALKEGS